MTRSRLLHPVCALYSWEQRAGPPCRLLVALFEHTKLHYTSNTTNGNSAPLGGSFGLSTTLHPDTVIAANKK
jgi:hypothetical protein